MQWWCFAQGTAWDWTWRAYPGIWAFMLVLIGAYALLIRRTQASTRERLTRMRYLGPASLGAALLWSMLDWPIGTLGAGYLASVHMVQFLVIAHIVSPLMLSGVPAAAYERLKEKDRIYGAVEIVTRPLISFTAYNIILVVTHLPPVVDTLMANPVGSMLIDLAWLVGGLVLWWPVIAPVPERERFPEPMKMVYLFMNTILPTAAGAFMIFSNYPLYSTYELAPPVGTLTALEDQQLAGLLMKIVGGLILWTAITVLFLRWSSSEEAEASGRDRLTARA